MAVTVLSIILSANIDVRYRHGRDGLATSLCGLGFRQRGRVEGLGVNCRPSLSHVVRGQLQRRKIVVVFDADAVVVNGGATAPGVATGPLDLCRCRGRRRRIARRRPSPS